MKTAARCRLDDGGLPGALDYPGERRHALPALVKRTLLDDAAESLRRQRLYTAQLRLQLPLLALQYKYEVSTT